jgi:hypothetical protein
MKLTTVLASTNNNPSYYKFIPKQILFWKYFNIKFIALFVGENIPDELEEYKENIILWDKPTNYILHTAYIAQNIRIYYPALLNLPDNEMVMITDMDMLPTNDKFYKDGLEHFTKKDFIYYRHIDGKQIYMCYNAAHPSVWSEVFNIGSEKDIERELINNYYIQYNGTPGSSGWYGDQEIMYNKLINYPNLKILNRYCNRLDIDILKGHIERGDKDVISVYDDFHFHRDYNSNEKYILIVQELVMSLKEQPLIYGKVSVIIPTFNRFKYLLNAIKSVKEQTYKNIEIIVINDCSTQKEYYEYDWEDVKIIHLNKNSKEIFGFACPSFVRNEGIRKSSGKYIAFLDDDDVWFPHKIHLQLNAMNKSECRMSSTDGLIGKGVYDITKSYLKYNAEHYYKELQNIYKINGSNLLENGFSDIWNLSFLKIHNCIICSSVLIEKEILDKINNFSLIRPPGEDYNCWLKSLEHTECVYVPRSCLYYDMDHGDGQNY